MSMPGFSADSALYQSRASYRSKSFAPSINALMPQAVRSNPSACYRACMRVCYQDCGDWCGWCSDECRGICRGPGSGGH